MKVWELDEGVRNTFFNNFIVNASLAGSAKQEKTKEKEGCNVPWAILLDPTSACNLHCTGCWAAEYGNRLNLTFDELDSIVTQGKNSVPICTSLPAENLWFAKRYHRAVRETF